MKILALSDTHSMHRKLGDYLPYADVMVFAGDLMNSGDDPRDIVDFGNWFRRQPANIKIVIAGNHDRFFEKCPGHAVHLLGPGITYLQDSGFEIGGVKFWGSPYTPEFCNWAFNRRRGAEIEKHWDMIPDDTDVLITHGPPESVLDTMYGGSHNLGCRDLWSAVRRVEPKVHIFGHIHGGYGVDDTLPRTTFYNVAICTEQYSPINKPIEIEL